MRDGEGGGTTVGSIELGERLSSGGEGELFLGRQPGLGRRVLVRKLRRDLPPESPVVQRLLRAARIASRIAHPNVLAVHDLFCHRGDHYVVLEHVDGRTLRESIESTGPMPARLVSGIGAQLADALSELHERGIVHADLRPEHIWLGRWGEIKLGGLGGARAVHEPEPPAAPPSSAYTAPEIAAGGTPSPPGDVFALGAVLTELVTGKAPSADPSLGALPRDLRRLLRSCLAPEPGRRPPIAQLRRALERGLPEGGLAEARVEVAAWRIEALRGSGRQPAPAAEDRASPHTRTTEPGHGSARSSALGRRAGIVAASAAGLAAALLLGAGVLELLRERSLPVLAPERTRSAAPESGPDTPIDAVPAVASAPARLRISALPWAEVRVDGAQAFFTPRAEPVELEPGTHRVVFEHPRFGRAEHEVTLAPGESKRLRHLYDAVRNP